MTMIKKDGHWVTVAGGQRMWVGTKAQLDAALAAGELEDGTAVMVTDDYEEGANTQAVSLTINTLTGLTVHATRAIKHGNVCTFNVDVNLNNFAEVGDTPIIEGLPTSSKDIAPNGNLHFMLQDWVTKTQLLGAYFNPSNGKVYINTMQQGTLSGEFVGTLTYICD